MYSGLVIIHRRSGEAFAPGYLSGRPHFLWRTCLRQILFAFASPHAELSLPMLQPMDEIYRDAQAYQFCLEVICGLHSPLIGETEVLGQFRQISKSWMAADADTLPLSRLLSRLTQQWFADAKKVRERHLTSTGSQSYGSVVRRYLKDISQVSLLGSGRLARDILPWILKDGVRVLVIGRRGERLHSLKSEFPGVGTITLDNFCLPEWRSACPSGHRPESSCLIVAAPASASNIGEILAAGDYGRVLDLRGESVTDPIVAGPWEVIALQSIFEQIEDGKTQALERARSAREQIQRLVREHGSRVENRPFGWDDLCA